MKSKGNPQIEDGFVKIANEFLEALTKALASGLITAREGAVVSYIIRYTYGFNRKNGYFHTAKIGKELGFSISWTSQLLRSLEEKKIIIRDGLDIQINKHYLEWQKSLESSKQKVKKSLEQSKQSLEQSKQKVKNVLNKSLEQSKLTPQRKIDKTKLTGNPKYIIKNINKDININTKESKQVKKQPVSKSKDSLKEKDSKKNEVYELFAFFYDQLNERNKRMGLPEVNIKHIKFPPQAKSAKVLLSWFPLSYWKSFLKSMFQVKGFYSEHCTSLRYLEEYYETALKQEVKKAWRR